MAPWRPMAYLAKDGVKDVSSTNPLPVSVLEDGSTDIPTVGLAVILTVQTAAIGTNWTAFGSQACAALDIVNETGTVIEYRRDGAGSAMPIGISVSRLVTGITNANQISVRRRDTSNTQVTVTAEALG